MSGFIIADATKDKRHDHSICTVAHRTRRSAENHDIPVSLETPGDSEREILAGHYRR
jgi:hypothetical protein